MAAVGKAANSNGKHILPIWVCEAKVNTKRTTVGWVWKAEEDVRPMHTALVL